MIVAKGISKAYQALQVLKNVSVDIAKGEIISIVGASGAGKTTLLQILGTLDKPDGGSVNINGENILQLGKNKLAVFRNHHLGFIFQFHYLLPEFTTIENICLPAYIKGTSKKQAQIRAEELLEILNLSHRNNHKPSELSGGEQQRVAVARALINNPSVVFADEPSGNLDSQNAKELHQLFFDLRKMFNQTFVIVTHNEDLANMADRKLTMKDGEIQ